MGSTTSSRGLVDEEGQEPPPSTTSAGPYVDSPPEDGAQAEPAQSGPGERSTGSADDDSPSVPTVFKWELGGREVFITGTFNGWSEQIPMHQSGNDFTYVHDLARGRHAYKFVVDGQWRYAPDQPTVSDVAGHVNNFIDVSDFRPSLEDASLAPVPSAATLYGQRIPSEDECHKEPPPLPPHLRHNILNKVPPPHAPTQLPMPQHVALNHLYCTAIKDGIMVLGMTQRYREKCVTTVYYSVMPVATISM